MGGSKEGEALLSPGLRGATSSGTGEKGKELSGEERNKIRR